MRQRRRRALEIGLRLIAISWGHASATGVHVRVAARVVGWCGREEVGLRVPQRDDGVGVARRNVGKVRAPFVYLAAHVLLQCAPLPLAAANCACYAAIVAGAVWLFASSTFRRVGARQRPRRLCGARRLLALLAFARPSCPLDPRYCAAV